MFTLFIVFLSFSESSARVTKASDRTKCLFSNDEPCTVRLPNIDMNAVDIKYYPFVISLNKCTGICNFLSPKICVPKENKRHKC